MAENVKNVNLLAHVGNLAYLCNRFRNRDINHIKLYQLWSTSTLKQGQKVKTFL